MSRMSWLYFSGFSEGKIIICSDSYTRVNWKLEYILCPSLPAIIEPHCPLPYELNDTYLVPIKAGQEE